MKSTDKMGLKIIENSVYDEFAEEMLNSYSDNFSKIEEWVEGKIDNIENLVSGQLYKKSDRMLNINPDIGNYVGWINIREGIFAKKWTANTDYSVGDLVRPNSDNGHVYRCVSNGKSQSIEPLFNTTSSSQTVDLRNANTWNPDQSYQVEDIVIPTNGADTYYYKCIVSGTSGETEPTWNSNQGTTIVDGSVTWLVEKTAKWEEFGTACLFRPYGKIE